MRVKCILERTKFSQQIQRSTIKAVKRVLRLKKILEDEKEFHIHKTVIECFK